MTTAPKSETPSAKTGHRPGRNPEEPRNQTVCFTVSDSEKAAIDALGMCTNLRRSAILTEVTTLFLSALVAEPKAEADPVALLEFLEKCQSRVSESHDVFNTMSKGRK